jgi:hypothetical protein
MTTFAELQGIGMARDRCSGCGRELAWLDGSLFG